MTHVDFYFNAANVPSVAQRLIAKALASKANATVVIAADLDSLTYFDDYLWAFDATSFVPHMFYNDANTTLIAKTPVILIPNPLPSDVQLATVLSASHADLLINIGHTVPQIFARFTRLIELVGVDETSKTKGRERFTHYKQRGYPMSHLDLTKA
jgi:DNA polymerase III subunit chi